MRRGLGTVALAALLISGCGEQNDAVDFSAEASATCKWARQSVDVLPERSSELLKRAAEHLRRLEVPDAQRAGADTLVAELGQLSRSADALSSEPGATKPDPVRMRRLRAAVQDHQQKIAATAKTLRVSDCDAVTGILLRDGATADAAAEVTVSAPNAPSRATYRAGLRDALGDITQRTVQVQATLRSGNGSASTLTNYAASLGTVVNRLQALRPPAIVASTHGSLVAGLRAIRTATTRAARDLRAGAAQRATQRLTRFFASPALKDLSTASATLRKGGYLPD